MIPVGQTEEGQSHYPGGLMAPSDTSNVDDLLASFLSGDYSRFEELASSVDEAWQQYGRQFPPGFYETIRSHLVQSLIDVGGDAAIDEEREPLKLRVVIDSSTLVLEAFRVARGRPSSTPRLFDSPFVQLYAPTHVREETARIIHQKLPRGADEPRALQHVEDLLRRVTILPHLTTEALAQARKILMPTAPEDVPFLAVALDTKSPFIVSTDRVAFDNLVPVQRWFLKDYASAVVSLEVGGLSLVLFGTGAELLVSAFEMVIISVARGIYEILSVLAAAAVGLVHGAADALSKIPPWAAALVLGIAAGAAIYVGIRALLDVEFRQKVAEGFSMIADAVMRAFDAVLSWTRGVIEAVWNLLKWIWTFVKPIGQLSLLTIYVLARESKSFLETCERTVREASN